MADATATAKTPRRSPRRRFLRATGWTLATLVIFLGVGLLIVTRSWFIIWMVKPQLEAKLGGDVTIGSAAYQGGGEIIFRDFVLRSPAHRGRAGEVLRIGRATFHLSTGALTRGSIQIEYVEVDSLCMRAAEDAQRPGVFSYMSLAPKWDGKKTVKSTMLPPRIQIRNAVIEMGTYDGDAYEMVGARRVSGNMHPSTDEPPWYSFELAEVDLNGNGLGEDGIQIRGRWDAATFAYRGAIDGLRLDERAYRMCPQRGRLLWDRMQLDGEVSQVVLEWDGKSPLQARMSIENVGLTLPIDTPEFWSSFRNGQVETATGRPRMQVRAGTMRLAGDRLMLEDLEGVFTSSHAVGRVVPVPYSVDLSVQMLTEVDWQNKQQWLEDALAMAPFEMTLQMNDFRVEPDADGVQPAVEMPTAVARVLGKFELTNWVLKTQVKVSRAAPSRDANGQLVSSDIRHEGQAFVSDASALYFKFPYRLTDVSAYLQFDNDRLVVHYLTGKGAGESTVRMTGTVTPPDGHPKVSLHVTAERVPVDERLRGALRPGTQKVFDSLMHRPSFDSLQAAGLIIDEADIAEAKQTLLARQAELHALQQRTGGAAATQPAPGDEAVVVDVLADAARDALVADIARLQHIIEGGPFELGGLVDLDLTIEHPGGKGMPTTTTGKIVVRSAGIIYERFPYPVHVLGGVIDWQADRIVIVEDEAHPGVQLATPGGGRGAMRGQLLMPDGGTSVLPELRLDMLRDQVTEQLLAAIPLTPDEKKLPEAATWPGGARSPAAKLLKSINLAGLLDYTGTISTDADKKPIYDFAVRISEAAAQPTGELSKMVGALGLVWPEGFTLHNITGLLHITPDEVKLAELVGNHTDGAVTVAGVIDLKSEPSQTSLDVRFADLTLGRYILDLLPGDGLKKIRSLWDRYRPSGTFDASLQYRAIGSDVQPASLQVVPKTIHAMIANRPITFTGAGGALSIADGAVRFDDLALSVQSRAGDDGVVTLTGAYSAAAKEGLSVRGAWKNGALQSPLLSEAIELIGGKPAAERFLKLNLAGLFGADFSYDSARDTLPAQYALTLQPQQFQATIGETQISASIAGNGSLTFTPGRIVLQGLTGHIGDGDFDVSGTVNHAGPVSVDLEVSYDGRTLSPELLALMPAQIRNLLTNMRVQTSRQIKFERATVRAAQVPQLDGKMRWQSSVNAHVDVRGGSCEAGVRFAQVAGGFDVAVATPADPGSPAQLRINADLDRLVIAGRALTNLTGRLALSEDGKSLLVDDLRAESYGGVICGSGTVGLGNNKSYAAQLDLVGVALQDLASGTRADRSVPRMARSKAPVGDLYARVDLAGQRGDPASRVGSGQIRVARGRMVSNPVMLRLLQLIELMPPLAGSLDYADIGFYIAGDRAYFEQFMLESPTLTLVGRGSINIDNFNVDMRFSSRGKVGVISDLISGVSGTLMGIEVTGPLGSPAVRIVPLPALSEAQTPSNVARSAGVTNGSVR